ncbi:ubiquinone anaerobic biosynthesis accessory factor UbiT [Idiomarina seosinensis]|uniref:Ubiquinone biosynthesis accessory factor UbiT n=1 Tax=Idiomarina seosinensis TaxID=281739 RepID=A0A432ZDW3_9GAMM|nr:SCP2 sterol-binding domain-containing protein [Idiomarina seosinensis]RUO76089.1 lipid carrier protein [Idiomarina seosinensis]
MDTNKWVIGLPKVIASTHELLPAAVKFKPFQLILNKLFRNELAQGELDFLTAKTVTIEVTDIALSFDVSIVNQRLVVTYSDHTSDAKLSADSADLLLLIHNKVDPDTLFFRRRLKVEGSTELGLSLKNFLDTIEVDQKLPDPLYRLGDKLASYIQQQKDGIIIAS